VLLAATAAGVSYAIAIQIFGSREALFAPIAAVVCTGLTAGQRLRRAVELSIGVAVGLTVADLLLQFFGVGPLQLAMAVLLAMTATVALGANALMTNQAAVAAVVLIALTPEGPIQPTARLADALLGATVALTLNAVVGRSPRRTAADVATGVLKDLASILTGLTEALAEQDRDAAERFGARAAGLTRRLPDVDDALSAARDSARLSRLAYRRQSLQHLARVEKVRDRIGLMTATTQSLSRAIGNAVRGNHRPEDRVLEGLWVLASSLESLAAWVQDDVSADAAQYQALEAATLASPALSGSANPATIVMVGLLRSAVVDVLRATGLDQTTSLALIQQVAGSVASPDGDVER
jgi:uncharacterized membrane protein YgaE (UPF0421/DUF939 family)